MRLLSFPAAALALFLSTIVSARDVEVISLGAVGDGKTLNTAVMQKAIDACAEEGGGTVSVPAGKFLTGTLLLKSNVTLHLDKDATLLGSGNIADYRIVDLFTEGTGKSSGLFLIGAVDAKNVAIEGEGTIDGQGALLQKGVLDGQHLRPFLVRWVRSDMVSVKGVHLQSAAMWCMHISQSKNVNVDGVTIGNRGNANNDGIDLDSSQKVKISHCDIDSHDDAMCLKGTGATACKEIEISGCTLKSDCAAIKFGTESLGDFENIRITDCQIRDTHLGGIKLLSVDGGKIHDVLISDITMDGVNVPLFLRLGSRLKTFHEGDKPKTTGSIENVEIKNVRAINAKSVGILISGVPDHLIGGGIALSNIDIHLSAASVAPADGTSLAEKESAYPEITMFGKSFPATAIYARHVKGVSFKEIKISLEASDPRPFCWLDDAHDVTFQNFPVDPAAIHQEKNCSSIVQSASN